MTDLAYLGAAFAAERTDWPWLAGADRDGRRMTWAAVRHLLDMGVPAAFLGQLTGAGDLAIADVDLRRSGTFEFGGPTRRLILAVRERGSVVDLVALSSSCADEWALLRGAADMLGGEMIDDAVAAERRELRLFSTPLAWLRGGGRGICVLDWTPAALAALRGLGSRVGPSGGRAPVTLVVEPGAKPKLDALLAHGGLPIVSEDRPNMEIAA
jgi:hypothetical protein